jgi:hypothetical protein
MSSNREADIRSSSLGDRAGVGDITVKMQSALDRCAMKTTMDNIENPGQGRQRQDALTRAQMSCTLEDDRAIIAAARHALAAEQTVAGKELDRRKRLHDVIADHATALVRCMPHEHALESACELDEIAAELREFMR